MLNKIMLNFFSLEIDLRKEQTIVEDLKCSIVIKDQELKTKLENLQSDYDQKIDSEKESIAIQFSKMFEVHQAQERDMQKKIDASTDENRKLIVNIGLMNSEKEDILSKLEKLQAELQAEKNSSEKDLKDLNDRLANDAETFKKDLFEKNEAIQRMKSEIESLSSKATAQTQEAEKLKGELSEHVGKAQQYQMEIERLSQIKGKETELKEKQSQIETLTEKLQLTLKNAKRLEKEVNINCIL